MPRRNKIETYKYWAKYPWAKTLSSIKARCNNPKRPYYNKNIKNYLSLDNLKYLWFRDNAQDMKKPSIHRIDRTKGYTLENCQYIEVSEHRLHSKVFKTKGQWALKYKSCINCNRTQVKHTARGLCKTCYNKQYK